LNRININTLVEFLFNRLLIAPDPELEFGIQIEGAGCFYAVHRDLAIGYRQVFFLPTVHALHIHQDKPAIGENPGFSNDLEPGLDLLIFSEQPAEVPLNALAAHRASVAD